MHATHRRYPLFTWRSPVTRRTLHQKSLQNEDLNPRKEVLTTYVDCALLIWSRNLVISRNPCVFLRWTCLNRRRKQHARIMTHWPISARVLVWTLWSLQHCQNVSVKAVQEKYEMLCSFTNLLRQALTKTRANRNQKSQTFLQVKNRREDSSVCFQPRLPLRSEVLNPTRLLTNPLTAEPLAFTTSQPNQKHPRTKSRQLRRLDTISWHTNGCQQLCTCHICCRSICSLG